MQTTPETIAGISHMSSYLGLVATAVGGTGVFKSIEVVSAGEIGVRFRNGRAIRGKDSKHPWLPGAGKKDEPFAVLRPGIHGRLPFSHNIIKMSTVDQVSPLGDITADSKKSTAHDIKGSIGWRLLPEFDEKGELAIYHDDWERLMCLAAVQHLNSAGGLHEKIVERVADAVHAVMGDYDDPRQESSETVFADVQALRSDEFRTSYAVELLNLNIRGASFTDAEKLGSRLAAAHPWIGAVTAAAEAEVIELPTRTSGDSIA